MQDQGENGYNLAMIYGILRFCTYANTSETCVGGGSYPMANPAWTYFTAVFDGSQICVYANGVFLNSRSAASPTPSTGPLTFGIAQRGGYVDLTGSLVDLRVYSRALSTTEISGLYDTAVGLPSAPTNLQIYPGNGQVGLSWDTPVQGATVTDYMVNYRQSGTSSWAPFTHNPSVVNEQMVTGLTNGTSYDFQVTGISNANAGLPSGILTATPMAVPAPIAVSVAPNTSGSSPGNHTRFAATVINALNTSVTWSALLGTITPEGLYTAPVNTGTSTLTDTITATSVQDPTKSSTATLIISSGLVGWWPLDEGAGLVAYDNSGQGNDGTWSGTPSSASNTYYTTSAIGRVAGHFNGTDNSLTIGTRPAYQFTGPFTLSAWVNSTSNGTIVSMQDQGENGYNLAMIYGILRFCTYANTSETCVGGGSYPMANPAWTYFTAVFDGSQICVYANGVFLNSRSAASPTPSTGPLTFGIAQRGGYVDLTGSLVDLRVYSRALSTTEISGLYDTAVGLPSAPTNLQIYPGNGQVGLSWDTPVQGATVTDYMVNYRQSGTSSWAPFTHNPSVVNEQMVTGLTNGTSYDFQVIPVSILGNGTASIIATATPVSSRSNIVASDDDEFIGPFPSWLNVKKDFGAVGDGLVDDTTAFQYALNALQSGTSHASVLYIPTGTYKVTRSLAYISQNCDTYCTGKSIIGEDPGSTVLKWSGSATGSAMLTLDGINRMQLNRLRSR